MRHGGSVYMRTRFDKPRKASRYARGPAPIKAPGVSRGIGCHTGRCVKRLADPIAYAPGLYGAWGIGCYAGRCVKRLADPIAYAPGFYGAWDRGPAPIKAPGVSRGIGCYTGRCAKRAADPIAYAPGLYGAWGIAVPLP